MSAVADVLAAYTGSDGGKTRALFARLYALGLIGAIAVNLFRAQKASERAKKYRGGIRGQGSFRNMAYDRKQWAIDQLAGVLVEHGQVSFHTGERGKGPDYPGNWDGVRGQSADRIVRWIGRLLEAAHADTATAHHAAEAGHG